MGQHNHYEIDGDVIDEIAEDRDMDWDAAAEFVAQMQNNPDEAIICEECGQHELRGEFLPVKQYPTPDGETHGLCRECYVPLLEERTSLSPQEARVFALVYAGYGWSEVQDAEDIASGQLGSVVNRVKGKLPKAQDALAEAQATINVLGRWDKAVQF